MKSHYLRWLILRILTGSAHAQSSMSSPVQSFDSLAAEPLWPGFAGKAPLEIVGGIGHPGLNGQGRSGGLFVEMWSPRG